MEGMTWDLTVEMPEAIEDTTVGAVYESIETNLWQADGYFTQGATGLAIECLRSAWSEYVRFCDILRVYGGSGTEQLGSRLVRVLVERVGDSAAEIALGADPNGRPVWEALMAA